MPAPPHPGRGGGPGKGPPLHRCCHPRPTGTAIGVEVGPQGPHPAGNTEQRRQLLSSKDSGEGGLGPGPVPWVPLGPPEGLEADGRSEAPGCLWVRPRVWATNRAPDVVSSAIKKPGPPGRPRVCVCLCPSENECGASRGSRRRCSAAPGAGSRSRVWGGGQRWPRHPRHPRHQGAPAGSRRERAPRGPETRWAPAWWRGPARWAGDLGLRMAAGGGGRVGFREGEVGGAGGADAGTELLPRAALPPRRGMLPGPPRRWDAGREAPEEQGPSAGSDSGEAWTSGEEAPGEPGASPQDR